MAAATPRGFRAETVSSATSVTVALDPTSPTDGTAAQVGDWVAAVVILNGPSGDVLTPSESGWTEVHAGVGSVGTMLVKGYVRRRAAGETSYTFTNNIARYINAILVWGSGGDDIADWIIGAAKRRAEAPAETVTTTARSVTTTSPNNLVLAFAFERTTATETAAAITVTGGTKWAHSPQVGTGAISTITVSYVVQAAAGPTGDIVTTHPNAQATNGWAFQLVIPEGAPVVPGLPVKVSDGAGLVDGRLMVSDGGGTLVTPGAIRVVRPGFASVDAMLAAPGFTIAHRGGSRDYPEMSLYAYGQSTLRGYRALELSVGRTSDGVFFGLHDQTLDRTSGTSGLAASSLTWAQVQAYQIDGAVAANNPGQPDRPYMRIEELLDLYGQSHVILVDPKYILSAGPRAELLAVLADMPGATDRIVAKFYGVEGGLANNGWAKQAGDLGFKSWGYFYETDLADLPNYAGRWDILGMDYQAPQSAWDAILAYGKPVVAHICPDPAAVTLALGKGADGCMVSGVAGVAAA